MVDSRCNELKVGDYVVYIQRTDGNCSLALGTIKGFSSLFGKECAVISDWRDHKVYGKHMLKYPQAGQR